jgi:hypothetical protein
MKSEYLYCRDGSPTTSFNSKVKAWLSGKILLAEHSKPAAFEESRQLYDALIEELITSSCLSRRAAHRSLLSSLTEDLIFKVDLSAELAKRLPPGLISKRGIRSTIAQGVLKNMGENFVNLIVYALADYLGEQDNVLVDKGIPPSLKSELGLKRKFIGISERRDLELGIECDFCIFSRSNPLNSIIGSAKTRLKEVFHVGTMWKILFDMIGDPYCRKKWGLAAGGTTQDMLYIFATSDSIREGGVNSQGPDLKENGVRNLIAADASFFDYVFVSKTGLKYVSKSLSLKGGKESLFHELGCLLDLVRQKFSIP